MKTKKGCGKEHPLKEWNGLKCGDKWEDSYFCENCKPKNHSQVGEVENQPVKPEDSKGDNLGTNDFNLSEKIMSPYATPHVRVPDIKEFIKRDYKNLVLAKMGDISWQEYIRRRNKLSGGLGE